MCIKSNFKTVPLHPFKTNWTYNTCLRSSLPWTLNHAVSLNFTALACGFVVSDSALLFLSWEEVVMNYEFSPVLNWAANPVTPMILHGWCCHHVISERLTLTVFRKSPKPACFSFCPPLGLLCRGTPVSPSALAWGPILSHSCPADLHLQLTKMPASSHGCLARYVLFTSQMTCWGPN